MSEIVQQTWRDWSDGVITSIASDELPSSASPRARNTKLTKVGPGRAQLSSRLGCSTVNATAISGSPAIHGQLEFKSYDVSSGVYTTYHLLVSSGGRLDYKDSGTTTAQWDASTAAPFSSGAYRPDAAVAANLAFFCNGQSGNNKKAYIEAGTRKVRNWGIDRPTVGTFAGAAGAATGPTGTYELRVTYYNSRTGHESSASDTAASSVTLTDDKLNVSNVPVSADGQVDQRRIYVRNTENMANFYLVHTIEDNSSTSATGITWEDEDLVTMAPTTESNDPPPTLSACEWHASRMFGISPSSPTTLRYSNEGAPEAWNPDNTELINPIDGQSVIALHSAFGVLILLKTNSTWLLIGDSPSSWEIRPLDTHIGCAALQSVVSVRGITYWWSEYGLVSWEGNGRIRLISQELLAPTTDPTQLAYSQFSLVCACVDTVNRVVMFALPDINETRNTRILPYSYMLDRFEAELWNPLDIASLGVVDDSDGTPEVYIGGYHGQLFKWWDGFNDGVPSGTTSGTVTSATVGTLTDTGAAFVTAGNGLVGRYVYAVDATGLTVQRRRIASNTATQLTLASNWTTTPNTTYTYKIGAIDWQFDTNTVDFDQPFHRKRLQRLFLQTQATTANTTVDIDVFNAFSTSPARTIRVTLGPGGAVYGTAAYGTGQYGAGRTSSIHVSVAKVVQTVGLRLRSLLTGGQITLSKMQLGAELLSDNLGGGEGGTQIR
jgi:hypothetical protein